MDVTSEAVWEDESALRFRKIPCGLRKRAWFRSLSREARDLIIFLWTSGLDQSIPGLFPVTMGGLAEELGMDRKGLLTTWQDISGQFIGEADWNAGVIWLPCMFEYNQPRSPTNVQGWSFYFGEIADCRVKDRAFRHLERLCARRDQAAGGQKWTRSLSKLRQAVLVLRRYLGPIEDESPVADAENGVRALGAEGNECLHRSPPEPAPEPVAAPEPPRPEPHLVAVPDLEPEPIEDPGPDLPDLGGDGPRGTWIFPCRASRGGPKTWTLDHGEFERLERLYPEADVRQAANKAQEWCRQNWRRRKTAWHMRRFMTAWLERDRQAAARRREWAEARAKARAAQKAEGKKSWQERRAEDASRQAAAIRALGQRDEERWRQDAVSGPDHAKGLATLRAIMAEHGLDRPGQGTVAAGPRFQRPNTGGPSPS